jgi:hypothetical protein
MEVGKSLQKDGTEAFTRSETHHDRERVCPMTGIFKEFRTSYFES